MGHTNSSYTYQQQGIHPFQMDVLYSALPQAETSSPARVKFEFSNDPRQAGFASQDMDDAQASAAPLTYSPSSSSMDSSSPTFSGSAPDPSASGANMGPSSTLRSTGRVFSMPFPDSSLSHFELPEEFVGYAFPRHGSVGSLYPMTQSHELLDATSPFGSAAHHHYHYHGHRGGSGRYEHGTAMVPSSSSTSISSISSLPPSNGPKGAVGGVPGANKAIKQRRASLSPDTPSRVFNCMIDDCNKLFKRSEHLKRHVRSVHTQEKPFICPFPDCPKSFSRSDNLNQHIRVHRHDKEKAAPKPFTNFTAFLGGIEKTSDRTKAVMDAIVGDRYHDLVAWASNSLKQQHQQQQRIRSFTDDDHQQQQHKQDLLSLLLLQSGNGRHALEEQRQQEEKAVIRRWVDETRSPDHSGSRFSRPRYPASPITFQETFSTRDNWERSPMFQKSLDSDSQSKMKMERGRQKQALVLVGRSKAAAVNLAIGVFLVAEEEEGDHWREVWKFHGLVCVHEESLASEGWRSMQDEGAGHQLSIVNAAPTTSTTHRTQAQAQAQEEVDDSDDDYWGQYGDPDSSDDSNSNSNNKGSSNGDSSPTETTFSSPDSSFTPMTVCHPPVATKSLTTFAATTTKESPFASTFSRSIPTSGPNSRHWDVPGDDDDDDDDDEYWGKYGDHEDDNEPESEVSLKDSSHAAESQAERQKIDPLVPTAYDPISEVAILGSVFPPVPETVPEPVSVVGQVDPTALTLRLMNLIVHHSTTDDDDTTTTGYAGYGVDIQQDDRGRGGTRERSGSLIRLDSRLQQHHYDCSELDGPLESEHFLFGNNDDDDTSSILCC
ncbi:hypothetical protein BGX29_000285 [Mortierella sp. GBA35]|nr:hypothetical protein BGX29_000285 [Mortierella sp. GBA35]